MNKYLEVEFEQKLFILLNELRKDVIKNKEKKLLTVELEDEVNSFIYDRIKGNLIDEKKHGLKVMAMVLNEIILKC